MSQLLTRLEARLLSVTDPLMLAELKVRKACYLARTGYFDEARQTIAELRAQFGAGENPRISIWIMLAEGIAEIFQYVGPMAKDRIARAQLLALAIRDRELGAIASAWKAHIEFETSDFEAMARALSSAIDLADPLNHEANSRISMILSDCMYLYGDRSGAQYWFMKSRDHALKEGDQATIDALLYNRAAFGMAALRADRCIGPLDRDLVDLVHMEISSAENFQALANIASLNHLIRLCKARILVLMERYELALEVFQLVKSEGPFAAYNFSQDIVKLEMVYCLHKLGRQTKALQLFAEIGSLDSEAYDVDDKLVLSWMQFELAKAHCEFGDALLLGSNLDAMKTIYVDHKSRLCATVCGLLQTKGLQ